MAASGAEPEPLVDTIENWTIRSFPRALRHAIVAAARTRRLTVADALEQGMRAWLAGEGVAPPPVTLAVQQQVPGSQTDLAIAVAQLAYTVQILTVAETAASPGLLEAMARLVRDRLRGLATRLSRYCPDEPVDFAAPGVNPLPRGPQNLIPLPRSATSPRLRPRLVKR
jgi:hypothetical protein